MIRIWIGFISTRQIIRATPVTETLVSKPTSHPLPGLSYRQHEGWFGLIEEPDISILCQPCQETDAKCQVYLQRKKLRVKKEKLLKPPPQQTNGREKVDRSVLTIILENKDLFAMNANLMELVAAHFV